MPSSRRNIAAAIIKDTFEMMREKLPFIWWLPRHITYAANIFFWMVVMLRRADDIMLCFFSILLDISHADVFQYERRLL